jgi:hypothetical protein
VNSHSRNPSCSASGHQNGTLAVRKLIGISRAFQFCKSVQRHHLCVTRSLVQRALVLFEELLRDLHRRNVAVRP